MVSRYVDRYHIFEALQVSRLNGFNIAGWMFYVIMQVILLNVR